MKDQPNVYMLQEQLRELEARLSGLESRRTVQDVPTHPQEPTKPSTPLLGPTNQPIYISPPDQEDKITHKVFIDSSQWHELIEGSCPMGEYATDLGLVFKAYSGSWDKESTLPSVTVTGPSDKVKEWLDRFGPDASLPEVINHGLYRIFWKEGGSSLAAVGSDASGRRWYQPTNWISGPGFDWTKVSHVYRLY